MGPKYHIWSKRVLRSNNKTYKGYARLVDKSKEPILANSVSDLMFNKYGWNDGLIVELTSKDNKLWQTYNYPTY